MSHETRIKKLAQAAIDYGYQSALIFVWAKSKHENEIIAWAKGDKFPARTLKEAFDSLYESCADDTRKTRTVLEQSEIETPRSLDDLPETVKEWLLWNILKVLVEE